MLLVTRPQVDHIGQSDIHIRKSTGIVQRVAHRRSPNHIVSKQMVCLRLAAGGDPLWIDIGTSIEAVHIT